MGGWGLVLEMVCFSYILSVKPAPCILKESGDRSRGQSVDRAVNQALATSVDRAVKQAIEPIISRSSCQTGDRADNQSIVPISGRSYR
ncbi:hypothetical protein [Microcoleus sp. M2_B4]